MINKMKTAYLLLISVILTSISSCQEVKINNYELEAIALNEDGLPIEGIQVITGKLELQTKDPFPITKPVTTKPVLTDEAGRAVIRFESVQEASGNVTFSHDEYYSTRIRSNPWDMPDGFDGKSRKASVQTILKPIKKPIPMYAYCNMGAMEKAVNIPEFDKEYGFDLRLAEALPPLGNGEVADFHFTLSGSHSGKSGHDLSLSIVFPSDYDGVVEFTTPERTAMREPVRGGSILLSGYEAPNNGYILEIRRKDVRPNGVIDDSERNDVQRNFYFRTRSVVDSEGNLIHANYGKIYGDFHLMPANLDWGYLANFVIVTSYFNPTENDRNVEFDTKHNLLPHGRVNRP